MTDLWDHGIDLPKQKKDGTIVERNIPAFLSGKTLQLGHVGGDRPAVLGMADPQTPPPGVIAARSTNTNFFW